MKGEPQNGETNISLHKRPSGDQVRAGFRGYWFVAVMLAIAAIAITPWDASLADPSNLQEIPGDLKRIITLSELFAHGSGVVVIAIGIWLLASTQRRYIPRILLCALWPPLGVHLLKILFGRIRPIYYFDELSQTHYPSNMGETWVGWLPNETFNTVYISQSFPSAHAATVWGLAIGMTWVFPRGRWLFFALAMFGSVQRVTSWAHWPSDVLCGAAIAFVMAGAVTQNWGFGYVLGRIESNWGKSGNLKRSMASQSEKIETGTAAAVAESSCEDSRSSAA